MHILSPLNDNRTSWISGWGRMDARHYLRHRLRLWHFSSSVISFFKHPCAAIQWARCLNFGLTLPLLPYFMCANSKGSGKTARMRRLTWAFAGQLCGMYHNLMSWLISRAISTKIMWPGWGSNSQPLDKQPDSVCILWTSASYGRTTLLWNHTFKF